NILFNIRGDLHLKAFTCEDAMGYVVDDIYASVGAVEKEGFTPKEVEEGIRGLFILPWIENIESPAQIVPVMNLLQGLKGPVNERSLLNNAFERAIDRNFKDDRSFTHAMLARSREAATFVKAADMIGVWRDF